MTELPAALAALTTADAQLGLTSGEVVIVPHSPDWAHLYKGVAAHIQRVLAGLGSEVAHIGSTSVPGLAAKPVLDIAVGARPPVEADEYIARLQDAGFDFQMDLGIYGGLFFTVRAEPMTVIAHLHVVDIEDFQWRWYLAFRDGLRSDPKLRADYQRLKQASADAHGSDRDSYTKAKFDWVLGTVTTLDQGER